MNQALAGVSRVNARGERAINYLKAERCLKIANEYTPVALFAGGACIQYSSPTWGIQARLHHPPKGLRDGKESQKVVFKVRASDQDRGGAVAFVPAANS